MYLDEGLAGDERESDETLAVDGDDLVADVELAAAGRGSRGMHVGEDGGGEHAAPARLHDDHTQALAPLLRDDDLWFQVETVA